MNENHLCSRGADVVPVTRNPDRNDRGFLCGDGVTSYFCLSITSLSNEPSRAVDIFSPGNRQALNF